VARQHDHGQIARRNDCGRPERAMKKRDVPFQRHWLYYLILKYALIAVAVAVTFYTALRLYSG
jgi:hypothetical protein